MDMTPVHVYPGKRCDPNAGVGSKWFANDHLGLFGEHVAKTVWSMSSEDFHSF